MTETLTKIRPEYYTSRLRIFHSWRQIIITGEGLQNLGIRSALRTFEQGGYRATTVVTRPRSFEFKDRPLSTAMKGDAEDLTLWVPNSVASYDTQGVAEGGSSRDPKHSSFKQ
jgi:hypothetical protein